MIVKTRNINQAAFLTALGQTLIDVKDDYPNNTFIIEASPLTLWYEKTIGLIPYKKYCNQRIRLKERGRKLKGLPEHFTGKKEGFNFGQMAMVREFSKKEQEKYGTNIVSH